MSLLTQMQTLGLELWWMKHFLFKNHHNWDNWMGSVDGGGKHNIHCYRVLGPGNVWVVKSTGKRLFILFWKFVLSSFYWPSCYCFHKSLTRQWTKFLSGTDCGNCTLLPMFSKQIDQGRESQCEGGDPLSVSPPVSSNGSSNMNIQSFLKKCG